MLPAHIPVSYLGPSDHQSPVNTRSATGASLLTFVEEPSLCQLAWLLSERWRPVLVAPQPSLDGEVSRVFRDAELYEVAGLLRGQRRLSVHVQRGQLPVWRCGW